MSKHLRYSWRIRNVQVPIEVHCVEQLADCNQVQDCNKHSRLVELKIAHFGFFTFDSNSERKNLFKFHELKSTKGFQSLLKLHDVLQLFFPYTIILCPHFIDFSQTFPMWLSSIFSLNHLSYLTGGFKIRRC